MHSNLDTCHLCVARALCLRSVLREPAATVRPSFLHLCKEGVQAKERTFIFFGLIAAFFIFMIVSDI